MSLGRMSTYFEYSRVPGYLVPPLVQGLGGVLFVRFSPLWLPACEALGAALQYQTKVRPTKPAKCFGRKAAT